jgi:hypothetical protein
MGAQVWVDSPAVDPNPMAGSSGQMAVTAGSTRKVSPMNKKLMLLVAGALTALAFTALPGAASADETALKCEKTPCTFNVAGGVSTFSAKPSGDTVSCTSVSGSGEAINLNAQDETTTTKVSLLFHGCRETTTIFKFNCQSPGQPTGTIMASTATAHIIALAVPPAEKNNGVLITDNKATFTCAGGFSQTTVTGNVIGENEANCNAAASNTQRLNFAVPTHGNQKLTTWTGKTFNLEGQTEHLNTPEKGSKEYEVAGQAGTGTLTWNQNVQVKCVT